VLRLQASQDVVEIWPVYALDVTLLGEVRYRLPYLTELAFPFVCPDTLHLDNWRTGNVRILYRSIHDPI
jgi:hypothetical protein